jgi:hypothetical protein
MFVRVHRIIIKLSKLDITVVVCRNAAVRCYGRCASGRCLIAVRYPDNSTGNLSVQRRRVFFSRPFSDGFFNFFGLMLEDEAMGLVGGAIETVGGYIPHQCLFWPGNAEDNHVPARRATKLVFLCNECLFHSPLHFLNQTYSHHRGRGRSYIGDSN